jgi:hypothetical protein
VAEVLDCWQPAGWRTRDRVGREQEPSASSLHGNVYRCLTILPVSRAYAQGGNADTRAYAKDEMIENETAKPDREGQVRLDARLGRSSVTLCPGASGPPGPLRLWLRHLTRALALGTYTVKGYAGGESMPEARLWSMLEVCGCAADPSDLVLVPARARREPFPGARRPALWAREPRREGEASNKL